MSGSDVTKARYPSSDALTPAWDALHSAPENEMDQDCWLRGYFKLESGWTRNFDELLRREYAVAALGDVVGKQILDVGCGAGLYMVPLAKLGAHVTGQDLNPTHIAEAKANLDRHYCKAELSVGDATNLQFPDNFFDGIISGDFVEHIGLDQKRALFAELFRVLKPGGVLVIKTPNLDYLRVSIWLQRIAAVLRMRSPFDIHIAHTRNNPDNEHHGLTTFPVLRRLLLEQMFMPPTFFRHPLSKKPLPYLLQTALPRLPVVWRYCNKDLILAARKPVFYGFFH